MLKFILQILAVLAVFWIGDQAFGVNPTWQEVVLVCAAGFAFDFVSGLFD